MDVNQGQKIHVMCKAQKESDNDVRFMYGYDGYNPDQIKDQDYDFDVEYSDQN